MNESSSDKENGSSIRGLNLHGFSNPPRVMGSWRGELISPNKVMNGQNEVKTDALKVARDRASLPKKLAEMTSENERLKAELSNLAAKSEDDSEALRKSLIKQTNEYEGKIKDLSEAGKKALKWQKDAFEEKQQKLKAESTATAEAADMRAKQTSHKLEERNMMLERDLSIAQEELKRLESEKKLVKNRALAASENNSELTSVKRELRRSQTLLKEKTEVLDELQAELDADVSIKKKVAEVEKESCACVIS